ncbi:MAG: hypothetical protein ACE366_14300 [Bradymonadia bacterium]
MLSAAITAEARETTGASASDLDIQFAGALAFAEDGTLFVGDNHSGAIYAFEIPASKSDGQVASSSIRNIDYKIAEILGVHTGAVEINDMAVHPLSNEIYISVTRIEGFASLPVIVTISTDHRIGVLDMAALPLHRQALSGFPTSDVKFQGRGAHGVTLPRDAAKRARGIRSLAIMDMAFYQGELFVAGLAHDTFQSSLRRIAYPFDGTQGVATVEMYHIAHDNYESRAPIRAMSIQQIDGKPQLVGAYTCSPVVLVPLDTIEDGAKISANTIIDMGNGQPIDMVAFEMRGETMLFVTSNSRSPQVIPVKGLHAAAAVTHEDFERGPKLDLHPLMPFGPAGKAVMFEGVPLHIALIDGTFLASITRDAYTGDLNLDINPVMFPNRIHNLLAEMDFPKIEDRGAEG